jgi:ATP-binding cassette subfamily A (ABC1) protein 3
MQYSMRGSPSHAPQPTPVDEHIAIIQGLSTVERTLFPGSKFLTMMVKNLRLKWRTPISTLLETLLPVLFVLGLVGIWAAVSDGTQYEKNYVKATGETDVVDFVPALASAVCSHSGQPAIAGLRSCTAAEEASPRLDCFAEKDLPAKGFCSTVPALGLVANFLGFERPRYIPSLDEMITMQWLINATASSGMRKNSYQQSTRSLLNGGFVHFAPDTPAVRALAAHMNATSSLFRYAHGRFFGSATEAADFASSNEWAEKNWAVLEIARLDSTGLEVTLHMNRSGVPWTNKVVEVGNGIGSFDASKYIASGFLTLQDVVGRYYMSRILNQSEPPRTVHAPMGYQQYDTSGFLAIIGSMAALFLVFGYLYPVSQLVKRIVEEKENRVREAMMIMGLTTAPFYASWIVTYFIFQLVTALVAAAILKGTMLPKTDYAIIFFLYFLFGLSNITLSGAMSSFFSKSRIAALVAPVLFFIFAIPAFALPSDTPAGTMVILSLMGPTGFANGMRVLVDLEISGGATNANINKSFNGYPLPLVYFMLVLDTILYMLLTLYFDAVLPSEWGTRKHPCFCIVDPIRWCLRKSGAMSSADGEDHDGRDPHGAYEPTTPGRKPSVELRGLRKEFVLPNGQKMLAVNDLTFNMYENEVFALLGHNGAGKTTAMNLMTGMLQAEAGDCRFHGDSVRHDLTKVREQIGYCPQHNILWNELTCREHLDFFARLKGIPSDVRPRAVEAMLTAVDLQAKGDKFPTELSGGQKRKLSVGIAFVGGSRVVFLDEPTAGMDVAARRFTWELIKLMTPGRTVVLTTHFMDEADLLGNTIAIMAKGRLKCAGSSLFLKSRLGVGYTLTMACAHGTDSNQALVEALRQYVPNLDVMANSGGEVSVRLPMDAVPRFPALLSFLEENSQRLGIRGHGISVTTLEEIFLKTGHDDDDEAHVGVPVHPMGALPASHTAMPPQAMSASEEHGKLVWTKEVADAHATAPGQLVALVKKRFHYAKRDTRTIVMQIALPVICITFAMLLALIKFPGAPALVMGDYGKYDGPSDIAFAGCGSDWATYLPVQGVDANVTSGAALSEYLIRHEKQHADNRLGSHFCSDNNTAAALLNGTSLGTRAPASYLFTNNSIYSHAGPHALWELQQTWMRHEAGSRTLSMRVSSHPLPMSPYENAFMEAIVTVFVAIFVLIPFTFVPSTFVSFIVKEREVRALQLQRASGMKYTVYWASNFIFDILSFVITALLAIIIFAIFGRDEYVGDGTTFGATFFLLMLYGGAGVAGSYICSFFFDSHSTAQNIVMLGNFICGFMLVLLAYILSIISSTKDAGEGIKYLFRLVPAYCLGEGILNLATNEVKATFGAAESPWAMKVTGWPMLYMALEIPIFVAVVLFLDSPFRRAQQQKLTSDSSKPSANDEVEDEDVAVERQEIESGMRDQSDMVVVKHLRKHYPGNNGGVLAVKDLSFGVHRGEVFGFLGTNGAGKTTTISIMCGDQMPTSGDGWIAGCHVVKDAAKARSLIGYCPQFDALHDLLTVEEHMELYAELHGLSGRLKQEVVERLIETCGLQEHRVKESRSLSGGNKRKLSVAISLLGAPTVVFLDEPSAGMDPMARRQMWAVIEQVAAHCSVVLTTHHLEEIEALSSRMGIMVDGELKCIGPLQHLKSKFGSGFEMSLRVRHEDMVDAAESFVVGNLAGAVIQERRGAKLTIALPQSTRLSAVFELVERNKGAVGVTDYSVSQTSLESVFLRISANAKNVSDE